MAETKFITDKIQGRRFTSAGLSKCYRIILFAMLKHIKYGKLTIIDADQTYVFGDDATLEASVYVKDARFYGKTLVDGSIGAGEAYIEGWWDSPNATSVVELVAANITLLDKIENVLGWFRYPAFYIAKRRDKNTKRGAKKNIMAHYDLGNELYTRFLDDTMLYSAAIFSHDEASLSEASQQKLQRICEQLKLSSDDHLLEIGTGWGGMAVYAAKHFGCQVTTTTISEEQYEFARKWVIEEGLVDKVTLLKKDYRELDGQFDKIVSIEMIEAVGHEYFTTYFETCNRLLKSGGLMLIQSILIENERYDQYRKGTDFIQKYIFPGGALPSQSVIGHHINESTQMKLIDVYNFGHDYARTLELWRERFNENWAEIQQFGYNEKFKRLWNFYFHYCEGGFWQRRIDVAHFLMQKKCAH